MTQTTVDAPSKDRAQIPARTLRKDRYWLSPLTTFIVFTAWVVYATVRSMMGSSFWVDKYHYLTPFYSPCVSKACPPEAADFGRFIPAHLPFFLPYALISLPFLLGFRLTCYYYRKAYYRAFWLTPQACAVPDKSPARKIPGAYSGETRLPLILQNTHRYFWAIAGLISIVNTWDAVKAFHGADGGFGMGLGTIILWINVIMLWGYTLSCHSCRHVMGGRLKSFSKHPVRYWLWTQISKLNTRHGQFALITLFTLALTDAYVALVAHGAFSDLRIFN
ncbi:MAG: hypothetical protein JWP48_5553 [Actinoallomurus sp.]|jgi:hypothetical protein|nr:hypothetical protein [Actinoallomurus sp.]